MRSFFGVGLILVDLYSFGSENLITLFITIGNTICYAVILGFIIRGNGLNDFLPADIYIVTGNIVGFNVLTVQNRSMAQTMAVIDLTLEKNGDGLFSYDELRARVADAAAEYDNIVQEYGEEELDQAA